MSVSPNPSVARASAVVATVVVAATSAVHADVITEWHTLANDVLADTDDSLQTPGYASRSMAMVSLAMYDSINASSITASDTFYDYGTALDQYTSTASGEVAAMQAAYTVLSASYADQQATLDTAWSATMSRYDDTTATAAGLALGTQIGQSVLDARANDGYDTYVQYNVNYEVGHWQPDPNDPTQEAWGPAWGQVDTFAINNVSAFVPAASPSLDSVAYADSYNQVKELGSIDSTVRTADQTEAGLFWAYDRAGLGTPLTLFNDVLVTVAEQQGNSVEQNATLFAKANVAMADAGIVAWNTKFEYDLWRPVTGIRAGDEDGNTLTVADSDWTPLGAPNGEDTLGFTPGFPTYISGHATFGGALFTTLQEFYGTDDIAFEITSEELLSLLEDEDLQAAYGLDLDDAERSFDSFSAAMAENGVSRVYLGIHWDYDDFVGQDVGAEVALSIFHDYFAAAIPEPVALPAVAGFVALLVRRRRSV